MLKPWPRSGPLAKSELEKTQLTCETGINGPSKGHFEAPNQFALLQDKFA